MNVLVTGGAGFLGSHVADALSAAGHNVIVFDSIKSPYLIPSQQMVVGDIMDQKLIEKLTAQVEFVFHFAGIADIDECKKKPVDTAKINILGTVMLLEACVKAKVKRFVFASSAYVYSNLGYFYRTSKQTCEAYIEDYYELYGLKYTCLRYGSLYGPRADDRNGVYRLIKQAVENKKIVYHGSGNEQREYIHVADAAQSSVRILSTEFENTHIVLTGREKIKSADLLEMIKEMFNNAITIEFAPSTDKAHYNITPYSFNPKLGRKLVNNPHIDMGQGLLEQITSLYQQLNNKESEK